MNWPSKADREAWEIQQFLAAFSRAPGGCTLEVLTVRDKPDVFAQEIDGERRYGIELTSVYLDGKSVPDLHMDDSFDWLNLPYDAQHLKRYETRLVAMVGDKICAARKGYDLRYPLLLSVYVNEYISKYISAERWSEIQEAHWKDASEIAPFEALLFWNLPNGNVIVSFG